MDGPARAAAADGRRSRRRHRRRVDSSAGARLDLRRVSQRAPPAQPGYATLPPLWRKIVFASFCRVTKCTVFARPSNQANAAGEVGPRAIARGDPPSPPTTASELAVLEHLCLDIVSAAHACSVSSVPGRYGARIWLPVELSRPPNYTVSRWRVRSRAARAVPAVHPLHLLPHLCDGGAGRKSSMGARPRRTAVSKPVTRSPRPYTTVIHRRVTAGDPEAIGAPTPRPNLPGSR